MVHDKQAALRNITVDVKVEQVASTLTVTSFTAVSKEAVSYEKLLEQIVQLNSLERNGYYSCSMNDSQYLVKYTQRLILYDASNKNSAVQGVVGEGIIHLRAAMYSLLE